MNKCFFKTISLSMLLLSAGVTGRLFSMEQANFAIDTKFAEQEASLKEELNEIKAKMSQADAKSAEIAQDLLGYINENNQEAALALLNDCDVYANLFYKTQEMNDAKNFLWYRLCLRGVFSQLKRTRVLPILQAAHRNKMNSVVSQLRARAKINVTFQV